MATLSSSDSISLAPGAKDRVDVTTTEIESATSKDRLSADQSISPDQSLCSPNGQFRLVLQGDSNLCLYQEGRGAIWSTDTYRRDVVRATMQNDGNFVLYASRGPVWSSRSSSRGNQTSQLVLQDDGNLVIQSDGQNVWSSNTAQPQRLPKTKTDRLEANQVMYPEDSLIAPNGAYRLTLQRDGNFCLYQGQRRLWKSDTDDEGVGRAVLQTDGNLRLLKDSGSEAWSSRTGSRSGGTASLIIKDDGNVILTRNNSVIWSTNTKQRQYKPRTKMDRLEVGQVLTQDQALTSTNGLYKLVLQGDGNFVLYENTRALWASRTDRSGDDLRVELQDDANLVLYANEWPRWSTNTEGRGNANTALVLEDDGNLTMASDGNEIWSANTRQRQYKPRPNMDRLEAGQVLRQGDSLVSPNKKYKFIMQGDGNFVLYNENSKVLWAAASNGSDKAVMQDDGNLVVFQNGNSVKWSSGTAGRGNATSVLVMQDDGDAVIFSDGKRLWATATKARLPDRLEAGQSLWHGNELISPDKTCRMTFQSDGSFVLRQGDKVLWAHNHTVGATPATVTMQDDDNLIVGGRGSPEWTSDTRRRLGGGSAILFVRDSGDAIIKSDGIIIWSTNPALIQPWGPVDLQPVPEGSDQLKTGQYLTVGRSLTSNSKQFTATLQSDGQIIIRRNTTKDLVWSSNTTYNNVAKLQLDYNNDLAIYSTDNAKLWSSGSYDTTKTAGLIMHNDGNLATYGLWKAWQSNTKFAAMEGNVDRIQADQRLAADQALVAGDFKLTFTSNGHLCATKKDGSTTYFYCNQDVSNVKYLLFNMNGVLEFRDDRNNVLVTHESDSNDLGYRWGQCVFVFHSDGLGRIFLGDREVWSFENLARASTATPPQFNNTLESNATLAKGNDLRSSNGGHRLLMQDDGNLVIYNPRGRSIWAAGTWNRGDRVIMQPDANFVVYNGNQSSWASGTAGRQGWPQRRVRFVLQNNGKGEIYAGDEKIWST